MKRFGEFFRRSVPAETPAKEGEVEFGTKAPQAAEPEKGPNELLDLETRYQEEISDYWRFTKQKIRETEDDFQARIKTAKPEEIAGLITEKERIQDVYIDNRRRVEQNLLEWLEKQKLRLRKKNEQEPDQTEPNYY